MAPDQFFIISVFVHPPAKSGLASLSPSLRQPVYFLTRKFIPSAENA